MKTLISEQEISRRVTDLAADITAHYQGKPLTVVVILNGALLFAADLVRRIQLPLQWDTFAASSYANDRSSGNLKIRSDLKNSPAGRHILLVDDILDTGFTLKNIRELFLDRGALSVRTCILLNKHVSGKLFTEPDWVGFEIPDEYVIGYGMDSNEDFRNLPMIAVKE